MTICLLVYVNLFDIMYVFDEGAQFPSTISKVSYKFIGLFEDRGHQGPYSPYKPFNHNLYIGIIIFPHIDNQQSTGYNWPKKKQLK